MSMWWRCAVPQLLLALFARPGQASTCKEHTLDFILKKSDAFNQKIEDDVVKDLAKIGIKVNTRLLEKEAFNTAIFESDFHMCFTKTLGPPYDPHSFAAGWFRPRNDAHYPAMQQMQSPTMGALEELVRNVQTQEDPVQRQAEWTKILEEMHEEALSIPLWSRRVPAVWNTRLTGYEPAPQEFDYPMHTVEVLRGSSKVTVAPGLFVSTGPMDPHTYRPNEFFVSSWIYEGLVSYGAGGSIKPALAASWNVYPSGSGEEYKFTLRTGVKFHDGSDWNCAAAKMNFDHVLQPPLNTVNYHGWYDLPRNTESWRCEGEVFVVKLSKKYYPFLQELALVRPLRFLAPNGFKSGQGTDPKTENSCNPDTYFTANPSADGKTITCTSIKTPIGTGPWMYNRTVMNGDKVKEVIFMRNRQHWAYSSGTVEQLTAISYGSDTEVMAALKDESLDMVVAAGVLTPEQVQNIQRTEKKLQVVLGPALTNTIIVMNAAKGPTKDIKLRRTIQHAINKALIVKNELYGQGEVADSLFPKDAPYCDVDLTPRWDYDLEKAQLLNCPAQTISDSSTEGSDTGMIVGIVIGVAAVLLVAVAAGCFFFGKKTGYNELGAKQPQAGNTGAQQGTPAVIGQQA